MHIYIANIVIWYTVTAHFGDFNDFNYLSFNTE